MTPPREYFELCEPSSPGAQRIGFEYYQFADIDALQRMIDDRVISTGGQKTELEEEIQRLKDKIDSALKALE